VSVVSECRRLHGLAGLLNRAKERSPAAAHAAQRTGLRVEQRLCGVCVPTAAGGRHADRV